MALLLVSGCSWSEGDDSPNGQITVALTTLGNDTALSWDAVIADLPIYSQVYDTLVRITDDGEAKPDLAKSWEMSEDGKTYTFKLREGVPFHKGYGDLTADDVVFTAEKWLDPANTGFTPQAVQPYVESVESTDDTTVVFNLKRADPSFLETLSGTAWILSRSYVDKVGEDAASREPVGSGPFEWSSAKAGSEVTLTRASGHFDHDAAFETLTFRVIPDASTQVSALESGEVDVLQVDGDNLARTESQGFETLTVPSASQAWVVLPGLSANDSDDYRPEMPWVGDRSDPESLENARTVRRAMAMAIDKEEIINSLYAGAGAVEPFGYFMRDGFPGFSDDWQPLPYDPDEAKNMLADAGYPDGFSIELVDAGLPGIIQQSAMTQAIGQYWSKIGIDVKLSKMDVAAFIADNQSRSKDFDYALVYTVPIASMRPSANVRAIASSGVFRFVVNDGETDREIEEIVQEIEPAARAELTQKYMSRLIDEQYGLQIASLDAKFAISDRIAAWEIPDGFSDRLDNYEYISPAN